MTKISALLTDLTVLKKEVYIPQLGNEVGELHLIYHASISFLIFKRPNIRIFTVPHVYTPFPFVYIGDKEVWESTGLTLYSSLPSLLLSLSNLALHTTNTQKEIAKVLGNDE